MRVSKELQELTDKFINEFNDLAHSQERAGKDKGERNDLYYFHYFLSQAIADSKAVPQYKEGKYSCLMGMSEFDTNISKAMFQNRIQGFIGDIEERLKDDVLKGQEDYLVENVVKEDYKKETLGTKWGKNDKGGITILGTYKKFIDAEKITFDVKNTRNCFEGKVVLYKELKKKFLNDNDYEEVMMSDEVVFFDKKGENIMSIRINSNGREEGQFTHYKHIADINSFYMILKYT